MPAKDAIAAIQGSRVRPGNPGGADYLQHVATYERRLGGSVERLLENALDWEHLPWLHDTSFTWIKRQEAGQWGWRARVGLPSTQEPQEILLELLLDKDRQEWVSRVLEGPGAGNEIWSHTTAAGDHECDVFVEFHLAEVEPEHADAYGEAYRRLYARLYDEDEGMMIERQAQLDNLRVPGQPKLSPEPVSLGTLDEVRARVPFVFEFGGAPFRVVEFEGAFIAHSTVCTHFLGPMDHCKVEDGGVLTCPWHGCRFDLRTGKSCDGNSFVLKQAPKIIVEEDGSVSAVHCD